MFENNQYVVNPEYVMDRVEPNVYDRVYKEANKWEFVEPPEIGMCGNVRPSYNTIANEFTFEGSQFDENRIGMYNVISSALLLYRLMCIFECNVKSAGREGYKCMWWITLKHKETGEFLQFGEWKGAAGIWTKFHSKDELPKEYKRDVILLLNELCSQDCPHPYDGCVAGSVA